METGGEGFWERNQKSRFSGNSRGADQLKLSHQRVRIVVLRVGDWFQVIYKMRFGEENC